MSHDSDTISLARRGTTGKARTSGRSRLGAGLVEVPRVTARDPVQALMRDPSVPERRRFCAGCDSPVGRTRDGQPGRVRGWCPSCGAPFSFAPTLAPGELVGGQYEVLGCLAHGGMGWVYLAKDHNVSDRWVVLKGLLNTGDGDAMAAALAERRFLAEVEHPNIVKIFNFVQHESSGYIVMEYVGGQSLKQILATRCEHNDGRPDPLPVEQAIAYMLEILPALGYLHELGLLFCDFKLDNVIQTRNSLKLIDLGGVYRMDEPNAVVFGTVGYQAPEIAASGPSVSSDLFTVARTLALLCIDFQGYQDVYRFTLPAQGSVPLLEQYDSLYRFLLKGTAPSPEDRFQSAEEMADQLYGILREVVAEQTGKPVPAASTVFTGPQRSGTERPDWRALPRPQVAGDDPSAGFLATITVGNPQQQIVQLRAAPVQTAEVKLRLAATLAEVGQFDAASQRLGEIEGEDPSDWRTGWYRGVIELARGRPEHAATRFRAVYQTLPGELAPKLALAFAEESSAATADAASRYADSASPYADSASLYADSASLYADSASRWADAASRYADSASCYADAASWYEIVSRTDPSFTAAAFGLARCRLATGDRDGALAAYARVADSSSAYLDAQAARIRCLSCGPDDSGSATLEEVLQAGSILEGLPIEAEQRTRLTAELLERALVLAENGGDLERARLLGRQVAQRELRLGLEQAYRALARRASTSSERIALVDRANAVRPRTWI